jgi:isoaspartyl peptidase/L-asparaginase-like protein (Ntn-hydrolase superfamily)
MSTILATWERPGKVAIEAARQRLLESGSIEDALEHGLAVAELDESLIAIGRGSIPNADGEIELDAGIMRGSDLAVGAVCAVRGILPAIALARKVMLETKHVMLAGDAARRFALEQGMRVHNLLSEDSIRRYREWEKDHRYEDLYVHSSEEKPVPDTITMLGNDANGCVAASSTSGLAFKLAGRVGDSPIAGAGFYADDQVGCVGATGWGEDLWRTGASLRVVDAMAAGKSPQQACDLLIDKMVARRPETAGRHSVVFALNRQGEYGASCTARPFQLWADGGRGPTKQIFEPRHTA